MPRNHYQGEDNVKFLILILSAAVSLTSHSVFAKPLDENNIHSIRAQMQVSFIAKCKDAQGTTDGICNCLAHKANDMLSDQSLSECDIEKDGQACIAKAVADAAQKALAIDNIKVCDLQDAEKDTGSLDTKLRLQDKNLD